MGKIVTSKKGAYIDTNEWRYARDHAKQVVSGKDSSILSDHSRAQTRSRWQISPEGYKGKLLDYFAYTGEIIKKHRGLSKKENPTGVEAGEELYRDLQTVVGLLKDAGSIVNHAFVSRGMENLDPTMVKAGKKFDEGIYSRLTNLSKLADRYIELKKNDPSEEYILPGIKSVRNQIFELSKYIKENQLKWIDESALPTAEGRTPSRSFLTSQVLGIFAGVSLIGGLFFSSSNVTGNVIGDISSSTSGVVGSVLFLAGLATAFIAVFLWNKGKQNYSVYTKRSFRKKKR